MSLFHLQFIIRCDNGTAVAWPLNAKHGNMWFTHDPLSSIGYGSEAVAIADLDRWLDKFPCIISAEVLVWGEQNAS
jgi:hypothetical protein